MQCAARKQPHAGFMRTRDGRRVCFVADPAHAPQDGTVYAHPDDASDSGPTWRELVRRYNEEREGNPLNLLPAHALYPDNAYKRLTEHVGSERLYILSAGWGLIGADFLTPYYDITFSARADSSKKRKKSDTYLDFCMLPESSKETIVLFAGSQYVPLFASLTSAVKTPKVIFSRSAHAIAPPGTSLVRFDTPRTTNWQYDCVKAFIEGKLESAVSFAAGLAA